MRPKGSISYSQPQQSNRALQGNGLLPPRGTTALVVALALAGFTLSSCRSRFNPDASQKTIRAESPAESVRKAIDSLTKKGKALGLVNTTTSRAEWKAKVLVGSRSGGTAQDPRDLIEKTLIPEFAALAKSDPRYSLKKRDYVQEGFAAKTRTEYRFSMSYLTKSNLDGTTDLQPRETTLKLRVRDYENMRYDARHDFLGTRFDLRSLANTPTELPNINDWKTKFDNPEAVRFWEFKENVSAFETPEGTTVFVNKHRLALTKTDVDAHMASKSGLLRALANPRPGLVAEQSPATTFDISKYWVNDVNAPVEALKAAFQYTLGKLQSGASIADLTSKEQMEKDPKLRFELDLGLILIDLNKGKELLKTTDPENFRERTYYLNFQLSDFHKFMRNNEPLGAEPYILNIRDVLVGLDTSGQGVPSVQFQDDADLKSLLENRRERLTKLAWMVQDWCDAMFATTRILFEATGARFFTPKYILEYVRNSYEATFPVKFPDKPEKVTRVQLTVDRDVTLSTLSGNTQTRISPVGNEAVFPRNLVVFEQKFDPEYINIDYDPLLKPVGNMPRNNTNQEIVENSEGLKLMYGLRSGIYSNPSTSDKRSGKAADVPAWSPWMFFGTWSDTQGQIGYMLNREKKNVKNQLALAMISLDDTIHYMGRNLRLLVNSVPEDQIISFEKIDAAKAQDALEPATEQVEE